MKRDQHREEESINKEEREKGGEEEKQGKNRKPTTMTHTKEDKSHHSFSDEHTHPLTRTNTPALAVALDGRTMTAVMTLGCCCCCWRSLLRCCPPERILARVVLPLQRTPGGGSRPSASQTRRKTIRRGGENTCEEVVLWDWASCCADTRLGTRCPATGSDPESWLG